MTQHSMNIMLIQTQLSRRKNIFEMNLPQKRLTHSYPLDISTLHICDDDNELASKSFHKEAVMRSKKYNGDDKRALCPSALCLTSSEHECDDDSMHIHDNVNSSKTSVIEKLSNSIDC